MHSTGKEPSIEADGKRLVRYLPIPAVGTTRFGYASSPASSNPRRRDGRPGPVRRRPAARRVLASVVASCVLVAGLATSATSAAADAGEGFVNRESLCREASEPFDDVDGGHVAAYAVACLYVLGIVYGHTPSSYDPSGVLRRNQLAAMLERAWRGVGRDCPEVAARYVDIADDWAKASIDCLWALGATVATTVTAGIHGDAPTTPPAGNNDAATVGASSPDGDAVHPAAPPTAAGEAVHPSAPPTAAAALEPLLFHPDGSVTNAQFALVVAKTWQVAGFSCEPHDGFDFTDVDYTSEAGPAIECLQSLAVVPLYRGATAFQPDTPITRGEAAILLARLWRYGPLAPPITTTAITISVPLGPITQPPIQQDPPAQDPAPTAPGAPGAPGLAAGDTELTASWSAPSDNGGSDITGYRVQHRTAGASPQGASASSQSSPTISEWLDANQLSHTLNQLTNGTEYEVKVKARNAVGESGWSPSATATPAKPDSAPAAPAAPKLTPGNATLLASWSQPADGGSAITGYKVRHRISSEPGISGASASSQSAWETSDMLRADQRSYMITSLDNGIKYEVQVQAANSVGDSDWSPAATATPLAVPAKPAAPTLSADNTKIDASWSAPSNNGRPITGYKVQYRKTGAPSWTTSSALGTSPLSYEIGSLTNGTEYEVQVQATNAVGDSPWSDSAKDTPRTVPAKPAAPSLSSGNAKLNASWSAPNDGGSDITGYTVRYKKTSDTNWTTSSSQTDTSYEITTLTNGTEYEVQVQATNALGDSGWSDSAKDTPEAVPDAPTAPTLSASDTKIDASWSAPSDGGSEITGYTVRYKKTSDTNWTTSSSQTDTSYEITTLTNGTEYEVQVQATNAVGDSGWSPSATATPHTIPSKPSPSLTPADQKITASWTAPDDGGSDITGYTVRYKKTSDTNWTTSSSQTDTSYEITTLTNGTEYEVQVQATNAAGDSGYSDSAKATPRTVPSKPSPSLTPADQKLTASWTAPDDGGSDITGYTIRYKKTSDTNWTTSSSQTDTSYEISSLTNGTEYEVQVQATNAAGDSGYSDSAKATPRTVPSKPDAPTLTGGDQKLSVSWSAPNSGGSAITGYKVRHRATDTTDWTTSSALSTSPLSYDISSLTNGTEYEVQVQATNIAGDSGWSDSAEARPKTAPSKPTPALTPGDQKLTATWSPPSNGGPAIIFYKVRHRATGTDDWTESAELGESTRTHEIGSLTNGTEYEVQVNAKNRVGWGGWSDSAKAVPRTVPSKPDAPSLTWADQKLTATWTAPSNGGSDITGYKVRHRATDTTDWTTSSALSTSPLSYDISSLTNGTEYEVQVQATNAAGDSGWSDSAKDTPRKVPSKPSPSLTPADKKLTATWTAPSNGGSAITGYKVRHRATDTTDWTTSSSLGSSTTSYDMTSLTNGTEYEVQVQATNSVGDSGWSDSVKAKACAVPSKPSPSLTPADQKLTASWTAPTDGGCDITGYTIRHRATDTTDWTTSSSQTGTSYDISSLTNGTEYEVQVQATNAAGDSGYSDSVKATPRTVPSKPSPTLTPAHKKLTASWTAPNNGGSDITGYTIRHRETDTTDWTTSSSQTGTSYDISSLTNGTEYEVQVQATNAAGDSGYSDSVKAKPRTVPSKPAAPTLTSDDASLEVTWSAPSDGGSDITAYKVQHRQTGTTDWTTSSALGTSTLEYEITQLTNGTEYEVQVQATNAAGDSGYSDSAKAKPRTVPSKPSPTLTPAHKKLTAAWTAPNNGGSDITGYKVRHRETETTDWTTSSSQTGTSYEISSLTNGTEYEVQVQATNAAGDSGWSDSVKATPRTKPSKPAAPTLTAADEKLTATWTAPNNGGSDITAYKVRHRISDVSNSPWTTSSALGTTTLSYEIGSLTNGIEYDVQVQATNVAGDSAWSDASEATPPSLTAGNLTDTAATLTLSGTISGNTTGNWWLKRTSPADTTCTSKSTTYTHSLSSLTPGDSYTYEAYSDSNCANSFADVTFTTLELTVSKITDSTATLTLTGNSSSWYYKADTSPDNSCSSTALSGSTTTKDLTGLSSGTTYNYSAYSNSTCTTKIATAAAFTTSNTTVHNRTAGRTGLTCVIGQVNTGVRSCLIGFNTGSNSGGYTVNSITADMANAQTYGGWPSGFKISLHSPSSNNTVNETAIANATFSGGNPGSNGWQTWDCSGSGCQLSANTTYYLAMSVTSANEFSYYGWHSTDDPGQSHLPTNNGWSITDSYRTGFGSNALTSGYSLRIQISATSN